MSEENPDSTDAMINPDNLVAGFVERFASPGVVWSRPSAVEVVGSSGECRSGS